MKKAFLLALCALCLPLAGCMRSVQLNERAIVQAIGIDRAGDAYALTLQIFDPEAAGADDTSSGKILRAEGRTLAEAMRNANLKQGQEIFLGHTKLILLGEQIAVDGVEEVVAYFNADAQSRPNTDMLVAQGDAASVLREPLDSTILPVLSMKMLLEGYRDNGKLVRTQLRGIAGSLENPAVGAYLPVAAFSGDEEEAGIQIVGTAVLRDGKQSGVLSTEETRGILWAAGEIGKTQLTLEEEGIGIVTLNVVSSSVTVTARIENGAPFYAVSVRVRSNVGQEFAATQALQPSERCDRYEKAQEQLIRRETEHALEQLFHGIFCDALGYANILMQQQPDYWKQEGEAYPDVLDQVGFSVTVDSKINRGTTVAS
ncbi:MAG: Ger(x)C family spore germination protein [Oscillospiraceae bacterium]|nr:Ger(x)C family spore germination protein [Oscillospiraceae bacterium]